MERISIALTAALLIGAAQPCAAAGATGSGGLTARMASAMDANHDGVITREEFLSVSHDEALWARLDANADGVLDADELQRGIRFPRHTRF